MYGPINELACHIAFSELGGTSCIFKETPLSKKKRSENSVD
jgi:hypothetical protein